MYRVLLRKLILISICFTFPVSLLAAPASGIGQVANNLIEPVYIVSDFLGSAALVIGATCLFAAILRYFQYRVNPLAYPLSTVITLFIIGLVLLLLPFIYMLTESGIPYGLHIFQR